MDADRPANGHPGENGVKVLNLYLEIIKDMIQRAMNIHSILEPEISTISDEDLKDLKKKYRLADKQAYKSAVRLARKYPDVVNRSA